MYFLDSARGGRRRSMRTHESGERRIHAHLEEQTGREWRWRYLASRRQGDYTTCGYWCLGYLELLLAEDRWWTRDVTLLEGAARRGRNQPGSGLRGGIDLDAVIARVDASVPPEG